MFSLISGTAAIALLAANAIVLLLLVKAGVEIYHMGFSKEKRLLAIVLLLVTNWVGVFIYYFYAKGKLEEWLK